MRQLLGLGVIAVGGIAVYAAVTGNYKQVLTALGVSSGTAKTGVGTAVGAPPKPSVSSSIVTS